MTVNTSNSASAPTTSNRLGDQKISPILEEATAEKTSDVASRTLQPSPSELSLVLQKQDQLAKELKEMDKQFSTELKQLSLKLSLILQKLDRNKQPIVSLCPPPPPPPPSFSIINLSAQTTTTLTSEMQLAKPMGNLRRSQSLRIKTSKEPIATERQIAEGLKNLRSSKNGNETNTTPLLDIKPIPLTENFSQSQLKCVEKKQDENEKPETEEAMSVAAIRKKFKDLSGKLN
jgi:hypothetical protein